MKLVSLFSGCGGLDAGFHKAGFQTVLAVDKDKAAAKVYELNYLGVMRCMAIDKVSEYPSGIVGVIGGPPCQSWSLAGNGRGVDDPRGALFMDYIKVIGGIKPEFFLAENVPGLVSKRHQSKYAEIHQALSDLGYLVKGRVLNSEEYGVPQERRRLIMVGYRKDLGIVPGFPTPLTIRHNLADALKGVPEHPVLSQRYQAPYSSMYKSRNRRRGWGQPSYTIVASASHVSQHPEGSRSVNGHFTSEPMRLSPMECARIQTFQDSWQWGDVSVVVAHRLIGNAVPPKLAYALAKNIKKELGYHD